MIKNMFALCLIFNLGLSANAVSENVEVKTQKVVKFKAGKHNVVEQTYHENGTLKSFEVAKTDIPRGTYTEYYENGNLKSFMIIK